MSDIFERIREDPILDYLKLETNSEFKSVGSNTHRANPCPLCGHFDSFTIYSSNQSFNCFSCEKGGDVITFEKLYRNFNSNLEAARSIAQKMNIRIDPNEHKGRKSKGDVKSRKPAKVEDEGGDHTAGRSGDERLLALREVAAQFYHHELLNNNAALQYQTEVRKHSIEVLKRFMVGYVAGDLIGHCKRNGFTINELLDSGIARKRGRGISHTVKTGFYIYPHVKSGKVVYFTLKDPDKRYRFQLKKKYAADGWLCYNQDALTVGSEPIILVEGEDDVITVSDKAGRDNVIGIIGNFNISNIISFLEQNSLCKTFYLCCDQDDAGSKYISKLSSAILKGGSQVKVIEIPEPFNDPDEYLRASSDPETDFSKLMKDARAVNQEPGKDPSLSYRSHDFKSFRVIGELPDSRIYIRSLINAKDYFLSLRDLTLDALCQIGGIEVATRVSRQECEGMVIFRELKKKIIVEAARKQLGDPEFLGAGIHLLNDGERLLINSGTRAASYDGVKFFEQDSSLIDGDGRFVELRRTDKWIDLAALQKRVLEMNNARALDIIQELRGIFCQWRFRGNSDTDVLTGWILARTIQSVWVFRNHFWVLGKQASGKSTLSEAIGLLSGNLNLLCQGKSVTEAGLRQLVSNRACHINIDEFEASKNREQIIETMRIAGRGGLTIKGSVMQKAVLHRLRHMILLLSIESGFQRAAEKNRYLWIETQKDSSCNPNLPNSSTASRLQLDMTAYTIWAAFRARELVASVGSFAGFDNRQIETLAVTFSLLAVPFKKPLETLKNYIIDFLKEFETRNANEILEDEDRLLLDIFSSQIRITEQHLGDFSDITRTTYETRTISQVIEMAQDSDISSDHHKTLQAHGISICEDGFFIHPSQVARILLRDVEPWRGLNIGPILGRIDGAIKATRRMAGRPQRGVLIPFEACLLKDDCIEN